MVVFTTEQVTKTSACHDIIVLPLSGLHATVHRPTSSYQQKLVTLQKLLGLSETVLPQSKIQNPAGLAVISKF